MLLSLIEWLAMKWQVALAKKDGTKKIPLRTAQGDFLAKGDDLRNACAPIVL